MRLTLLSHFIGRGGSTGFCLQLADFFRAAGHEIALVVGHDAPDPMAKEYRVVPWPEPRSWRTRMQEYVRVIESTKPDVVYTTCGQEEFEILRFLRFPRALHCGCVEQHEYSDLPLWYRQLEPYTELRTTHTPDMIERVKPRGPFKMQLAYAPHRLPEIFLCAPDVSQLLAQRKDDTIHICYLSRIEKYQKRAHWLPLIMRQCADAGAKLHWHIYGTGPAEDEVRAGIAKAGMADAVTFYGWQEPEYVAPRLGQHDLFFLCSRWEGLPAAMVEAMLCGLACLVPNFPAGMTFMIAQGGGWSYDANSPDACARALLQAVADRSRLDKARRQAQDIARALHARKVVDAHLWEVEKLIRGLRFNGNVADLRSARPMKLVTWPVLLRRKLMSVKRRVVGES